MDRRFKPELPQLQAPVVEAAPQIAPELQAAGVVLDAFARGDMHIIKELAAGNIPDGVDPKHAAHLGTMMTAANSVLTNGDRNTHGDGTVTTSVDDERLAAQQAAQAARGDVSAADSLVNDMRTGAATRQDGFGVSENRIGKDGLPNDAEVGGLLARLRASREPETNGLVDESRTSVFGPSTLGAPAEALPSRPAAAAQHEPPTGNGLHFVFDGAGPAKVVPTDGEPTRALDLDEAAHPTPHRYAARTEEPRERVGRHAAPVAASEETTHVIRRPQHPALAENTQRLVPGELAGRLDETHQLSPTTMARALGGAGLRRRANTLPYAAATSANTAADPGATTQKLWPQVNKGTAPAKRGRHAADDTEVGETTKRLPTAAAMRPVRLGEELPPSANPAVKVTAALQLGLGALRDRAGLVRPIGETTKQMTTTGMESTRTLDVSAPVGSPTEVTQQMPGQMPRELHL